MKLDGNAYSPKVLHQIVETAGHVKSFDLAAHLLELNAGLSISARHVNRLTQKIGQELAEQRDERTENYVHHRRAEPTVAAPAAVAVSVDGGRVNTREPGHGRGVHEPGWRENKVGCLQVLVGPTFPSDPHPDPPKCFLDGEHIKQLVKGFVQQKGLRSYDAAEPTSACTAAALQDSAATLLMPGDSATPAPEAKSAPATPETGAAETVAAETSAAETVAAADWPPKREQRSCVSSMVSSREFGKMLAAEAYARNFFAAKERGFLGDGLAYNWRIQQAWFADFTAILDFIHPLSYVYLAAKAVTSSAAETWQRYCGWMTACWRGQVATVIAEMGQEHTLLLARLGAAQGDMQASDPREVLRRTLNYLENNAARMAYPEYRKRGLPVTSAAVESLIKEFNYRVKGTEKFWNDSDGAETILQVRAAVLSADNRLANHILNRPGSVHRRSRPAKSTEATMAA